MRLRKNPHFLRFRTQFCHFFSQYVTRPPKSKPFSIHWCTSIAQFVFFDSYAMPFGWLGAQRAAQHNAYKAQIDTNFFVNNLCFCLSAFDSDKSEFIRHQNFTFRDKISHFAFAGNVNKVTFQQQSVSLRRHDWRTHSQRSVYVMYSERLTATVAEPESACRARVCVVCVGACKRNTL